MSEKTSFFENLICLEPITKILNKPSGQKLFYKFQLKNLEILIFNPSDDNLLLMHLDYAGEALNLDKHYAFWVLHFLWQFILIGLLLV